MPKCMPKSGSAPNLKQKSRLHEIPDRYQNQTKGGSAIPPDSLAAHAPRRGKKTRGRTSSRGRNHKKRHPKSSPTTSKEANKEETKESEEGSNKDEGQEDGEVCGEGDEDDDDEGTTLGDTDVISGDTTEDLEAEVQEGDSDRSNGIEPLRIDTAARTITRDVSPTSTPDSAGRSKRLSTRRRPRGSRLRKAPASGSKAAYRRMNSHKAKQARDNQKKKKVVATPPSLKNVKSRLFDYEERVKIEGQEKLRQVKKRVQAKRPPTMSKPKGTINLPVKRPRMELMGPRRSLKGFSRMVLCFCCGEKFSVLTVARHTESCLLGWSARYASLPPGVEMPATPEAPSRPLPSQLDSLDTYVTYNDEAQRIYEESLADCPYQCGRKLEPRRIGTHMQGCPRRPPPPKKEVDSVQQQAERETLDQAEKTDGEEGRELSAFLAMLHDAMPCLPLGTLIIIAAYDPHFSRDDLLEETPQLEAVPSDERESLFIHKCRLASVVFSFDDPVIVEPTTLEQTELDKDEQAKNAKVEQLQELTHYIGQIKLTEVMLRALLEMCGKNLFRPIPPKLPMGNPDGLTEDDDVESPGMDDVAMEPAWPHLHLTYELLLRLVATVSISSLKKGIKVPFARDFLKLMQSEDARERDYVKNILHRIYAKCFALRTFIRSGIINIFLEFTQVEHANGIVELLEIIASLITGFALPLKEEHVFLLKKVLLPMHKARSLPEFHDQLLMCVRQFVAKDTSLAPHCVRSLLRYWPLTFGKELLFVAEMEELINVIAPVEFSTLVTPLFKRLARSMGSQHFQVAQQGLFLWNREYISGLIADYRDDILPIVYPVLSFNAQWHWSGMVREISESVLQWFEELDPGLVQEVASQCEADEEEHMDRMEQREEYWDELAASVPAS